MPKPRRMIPPTAIPPVPPRGPRRPRNGKGTAGGIDPSDAVLRVLADLDFDPKRTSVEDVEARIFEIEAEAADVAGPGQEVYISDILADLVDQEEGDAPRSPLPGQATGMAFEERSLEVALIRGSLYLEMTSPVVALCPDQDHLVRRTLQGRAILACLILSSQAAPGTSTPIDDAILAVARDLGRDLTGRLPAECDLERPAFPAVTVTSDKDHPLRQAWEAMKPRIVARNALVVAARAAWHVGAEMSLAVSRPEA